MPARLVILVALLLTVPSNAAERWVRPLAASDPPLWGHTDGLRVGLHPLRGPRGLLRVYAPYLDPDPKKVINFIAIEPIVAGQRDRGLSELEHSDLDDAQGKRMWSVDDRTDRGGQLASGKIVDDGSVEKLVVHVRVEPFRSGAKVCVRLTFRADRPEEVALATFADDDSAALDRCIVTATMGNFARLRDLHLKDRIVNARSLWPDYTSDGFAPHAKFDLSELTRTPQGEAIAIATPDETNPQATTFPTNARPHWRYVGKAAQQFWRCDTPDPALQVLVNGRYMYWKSQAAIPGGIAFENFEMVAPFKQGQEFVFGVSPLKPAHESK